MNVSTNSVLKRIGMRSGTALGLIIIVALIAFEILNYGTTEFALSDFFGDFGFLGIRWAMLFAFALCLVDFAGIARIFNTDENKQSRKVANLFGAWLLCATINAVLTWWGLSIAMLNHDSLGTALVERETLLKIVPIFIAILVWLVRVLIIGTFSEAGAKLYKPLFSRSQEDLPLTIADEKMEKAIREGKMAEPSMNIFDTSQHRFSGVKNRLGI